MSDDWQIPDDLADRVREADYADAWKLEIERTAEVRAILTDLIAEVYAAHDRDDLHWAAAARESLMVAAADCAETRLREIDAPPKSANERINLGGGGNE
jgi:hypothetical protein